MKAVVIERYGRPADVLRIAEVDEPVPKDNEVLVNVHAAGVNDWDWGLVRGRPLPFRMLIGLRKPKIKIPGVDVAGRVEAVGPGARKFRPGDAVYGDLSESGFGAFAERVCVSEDALTRMPNGMSFVDAAAIPHAAMLAIQGLVDVGRLRAGQKVLINGAGGGVGTLGAQIAKPLGVELTGVDSAAKLDMMRGVGFDRVIDYRRTDFTRTGEHYDLILDAKTTRPPTAYARALRPGGTYVTVGGEIGRLLQILVVAPWIRRTRRKHLRIVALKPNKDMDHVAELFEAGRLKPVIDGPYTLSDIADAITRFGEGHHLGKVVVEPRHERDRP